MEGLDEGSGLLRPQHAEDEVVVGDVEGAAAEVHHEDH